VGDGWEVGPNFDVNGFFFKRFHCRRRENDNIQPPRNFSGFRSDEAQGVFLVLSIFKSVNDRLVIYYYYYYNIIEYNIYKYLSRWLPSFRQATLQARRLYCHAEGQRECKTYELFAKISCSDIPKQQLQDAYLFKKFWSSCVKSCIYRPYVLEYKSVRILYFLKYSNSELVYA